MAKATIEGTISYKNNFKNLTYNELGSTGLYVSQAGFGTYRVDVRAIHHCRAFARSLMSGINLVDTSSNYADGFAEILIGKVLEDLVKAGKLLRESVVVVSKGGYIQGQNLQISEQRKEQGQPFPELVEFAEGLEHCIHPEFLENQIDLSLKRLNMDTIDVYLLHNPEYYLINAYKQSQNIEQIRQEYYRRIENAFRYLETEVQKGRIQYYGISSNTFPESTEAPEFTSLEIIVNIARSVSPDNHFKVIQFPMNALETEAITLKNQSQGKTLLEVAKENNIAVLINRPLNAIHNNQLIRLSEIPVRPIYSPQETMEKLKELKILEQQVCDQILSIQSEDPVLKDLAKALTISEELNNNWQGFNDLEHWKVVFNQYYVSRFIFINKVITEGNILPEDQIKTVNSFLRQADLILHSIANFYKSKHNDMAFTIKKKLTENFPKLSQCQQLTRMVVRMLRKTPGVTSVLVGMRQEPYVDDVLSELESNTEDFFTVQQWEKIATQ